MAKPPTDELVWADDPALDEAARWAAFKTWEANQRRKFAQSDEAREEFRAWLASEPSLRSGSIQSVQPRGRKVYRLS